MRSVLLASLRTHTRRYVAAAVAVVVGVTFVLATAALSSATRDGMVSGIDAPYAGADAAVVGLSGADAARLLAGADRSGADAWVVGWAMLQVSSGGEVVDSSADVGQLPAEPHRWPTLEAGRYPDAPGEVVADEDAARGAGVEVGDRVRVGTGASAVDATVVGLVESPSAVASASLYLLWDDLEPWAEEMWVTSVAWAGEGGYDDARAAVRDLLPGADVRTVDGHVDELLTEINAGVDVTTTVLLLFAAVALAVAVLVISNTFAILLGQRLRELALLRCVGATRRQVLRAVRREALAIGVGSSLLGLVVGTLVGRGLVALLADRFGGLRLGEGDIALRWYAGALAVGVLVTLAAAWLPTRRAARVTPLEALRPEHPAGHRTAAGRLRAAAGAVTVLVGCLLLALAATQDVLAVLLAGGGAVFAGVLVLGPVLVPAVIRLLTAVSGRVLGAAGRLAGRNAVRNPRRSAASAASLLVGVTLTTAVLTGMASARDATEDLLDRDHPVDVALTASAPLPAAQVAEVAEVPGVRASLALAGAAARVEGLGDLPLLAAPDAGSAEVEAALHGDLPDPAPGEVLVPWSELDEAVHSGDRVDVTVGGRTQRLTVVGRDGWGAAVLVDGATYADVATRPAPYAVWVRAEEGTDPDELAGRLEAVAAGSELENGLAKRDWVTFQLDVLTASVVGLLGIAVLVALLGVANTLGLSVLERVREHALLRAVGLTRRQLRRTLAVEALLLTATAGLVGCGLGVAFAWAGVRTLVEPAVPDAALVLPVGQLALVVLVAALAGLAAAVLPARRAARVSPVAGLAAE